MTKKIFLASVIAVLTVLGVIVLNSMSVERVKAQGGVALSEYAWSETIGWVKFSGSNYGVNIDDDGKLSGYAWSENVGWIRFDPPGPYPACSASTCPAGAPDPNQPAYLYKGEGFYKWKIIGWARACGGIEPEVPEDCNGPDSDLSGGWDGWILMGPIFKNNALHSVRSFLDTKGTEDENDDECKLKGFAWGDDKVGWIKFRYKTGGVEKYAVKIDNKELCGPDEETENQPPTAPNPISTDSDSPSVYCGTTDLQSPPVGLHWTFNDNNNPNTPDGKQGSYQIQVVESGGDFEDENDIVFDSDEAPSDYPGYTFGPGDGIEWGKTYDWRVMVWDDADEPLSSPWSDIDTFTTPNNPYPLPRFSLQRSSPDILIPITLDTTGSTCYEDSPDCSDAITMGSWNFYSKISEAWTLIPKDATCEGVDDCVIVGDDPNPLNLIIQFTNRGQKLIELEITESGKTCNYTRETDVMRMPPGWQETVPKTNP